MVSGMLDCRDTAAYYVGDLTVECVATIDQYVRYLRNEGCMMVSPGKKILCIEDNPETAALIAEDLRERDYAVTIAPDGHAGLTAIMKTSPDLVLCDISMPGMTGFEVLESLTTLAPQFEALPFIFLTARTDRDSELKGRRLGANDYVTKPIDFERLATIIEARLGQGARHDVWSRQVALNDREVECLTWSGRGKTSIEIATILGLSKRTVDFHIDNACRKLNVATRTEAVVKATSGHLIDPKDGHGRCGQISS
jgi:DNA-binding NarL/FixJ family response regulator